MTDGALTARTGRIVRETVHSLPGLLVVVVIVVFVIVVAVFGEDADLAA